MNHRNSSSMLLTYCVIYWSHRVPPYSSLTTGTSTYFFLYCGLYRAERSCQMIHVASLLQCIHKNPVTFFPFWASSLNLDRSFNRAASPGGAVFYCSYHGRVIAWTRGRWGGGWEASSVGCYLSPRASVGVSHRGSWWI